MATNHAQRVVVLLDMDCFYVQVAQRKDPSIKGKPSAVVQYNTWRGGGIIAVSYEARKFGVTRQMRGDEAKKKCPQIILVQVPESRGKADLTQFREAGVEVMEVLAKFTENLERASIDEAYMDLTDEINKNLQEYTVANVALDTLKHSHLIGLQTKAGQDLPLEDDELKSTDVFKQWKSVLETSTESYRLAIGAVIANRMRKAVADQLGFSCSAGIGPNKMLAKIVAGFNKPNKQTLVLPWDVPEMFKTTKMRKIRSLGGKLGAQLEEKLKIEYMADLLPLTLQQLQAAVGIKPGETVYRLCRGVDEEPVRPRQLPKSIGCSKNFRGKLKLKNTQDVRKWLNNLCEEIVERLEKDKQQNDRVPTLFTVGCTNESDVSQSRRCQVVKYTVTELCDEAYRSLCDFNLSKTPTNWTPALINLHMTASKFIETVSHGRIKSYMVSNSKNEEHSNSSINQEKVIDSKKSHDTNHVVLESEIQTNDTTINTKTIDNQEILTSQVSTTHQMNENKDKSCASNITQENTRNLSLYFYKNSTKYENRNQNIELSERSSSTLKQHLENSKSSFFRRNPKNSELVPNTMKSPDPVQFSEPSDTSSIENNKTSSTKMNLESPNNLLNESNQNKVKYLPESPIPGGKFKKGQRQTIFERFLKPVVIAKAPSNVFNSNSNDSNTNNTKFNANCDAVNRNETHDVNILKKESGAPQSWNRPLPDFSLNSDYNPGNSSSSTISSTTTLNDLMTCERCGKRLLAWDLPDHMDFHFAQDIQDSIRYGDGGSDGRTSDNNRRNNVLQQNNQNKIHSPSRKRLKTTATATRGSSLTNYFALKKKE